MTYLSANQDELAADVADDRRKNMAYQLHKYSHHRVFSHHHRVLMDTQYLVLYDRYLVLQPPSRFATAISSFVTAIRVFLSISLANAFQLTTIS